MLNLLMTGSRSDVDTCATLDVTNDRRGTTSAHLAKRGPLAVRPLQAKPRSERTVSQNSGPIVSLVGILAHGNRAQANGRKKSTAATEHRTGALFSKRSKKKGKSIRNTRTSMFTKLIKHSMA